MSIDNWVVRTLEGEEWGFIKRLILDSVTRQIRHADVVIVGTGKIVRIPWERFLLQQEHIKLGADHREMNVTSLESSEGELAHTMGMDVWP